MALAHMLENDSKVNILSTPTLLTMENEEAKIVVGQNVPFVTGSYSSSSGTSGSSSVNPFQTIERKDIGLTLKVKPRVSGEDVKLVIYQEVSSIAATAKSTTGSSDIITNKRSIEASVMVKDGQIIVLGGLIQDNVGVEENKVPVLGSIPILGHLFRYDSRSQEKVNLMVFMRPYVILTPEDAKPLTADAYLSSQNKGKEMKADPHLMLPDIKMPALSPYQESKPLPKTKRESSVEDKKIDTGSEKEDATKKEKVDDGIREMLEGDDAMGKEEIKLEFI